MEKQPAPLIPYAVFRAVHQPGDFERVKTLKDAVNQHGGLPERDKLYPELMPPGYAGAVRAAWTAACLAQPLDEQMCQRASNPDKTLADARLVHFTGCVMVRGDDVGQNEMYARSLLGDGDFEHIRDLSKCAYEATRPYHTGNHWRGKGPFRGNMTALHSVPFDTDTVEWPMMQ